MQRMEISTTKCEKCCKVVLIAAGCLKINHYGSHLGKISVRNTDKKNLTRICIDQKHKVKEDPISARR